MLLDGILPLIDFNSVLQALKENLLHRVYIAHHVFRQDGGRLCGEKKAKLQHGCATPTGEEGAPWAWAWSWGLLFVLSGVARVGVGEL